jgi:DNA-binding Lrp family transcriptional regulator
MYLGDKRGFPKVLCNEKRPLTEVDQKILDFIKEHSPCQHKTIPLFFGITPSVAHYRLMKLCNRNLIKRVSSRPTFYSYCLD